MKRILILKFDPKKIFPSGVSSTFIGSEGKSDGRFFRPQGIAIDNEGRIIVSDTKNRRIQFFRSDGTFIQSFGAPGGNDGFSVSVNLVFEIINEICIS